MRIREALAVALVAASCTTGGPSYGEAYDICMDDMMAGMASYTTGWNSPQTAIVAEFCDGNAVFYQQGYRLAFKDGVPYDLVKP